MARISISSSSLPEGTGNSSKSELAAEIQSLDAQIANLNQRRAAVKKRMAQLSTDLIFLLADRSTGDQSLYDTFAAAFASASKPGMAIYVKTSAKKTFLGTTGEIPQSRQTSNDGSATLRFIWRSDELRRKFADK